MPISGSSTLEIVGATTLGSTLAVSGTATLAGTTNVQALTATAISASSTLQAVGATTLGSTLAVSGNVTLGDAVADVTTVTGQLTASQGGYFAGRVGIGTAAPGTILEIGDGTAADVVTINSLQGSNDTLMSTILFENNTDSIAMINAFRGSVVGAGELRFGTQKSSGVAYRMTIDEDGNVGIGTTTPSNTLTVDGSISGSSTLQAVGATTLGSTLAVSGTATLAGTTNAQALTATTISASSTLQAVGATVLGSTLAVTGNVTMAGTSINDSSGNELIGLGAAGSAINYARIANAAAGSGPSISAQGDDTHISLTLGVKGNQSSLIVSNDASVGALLMLNDGQSGGSLKQTGFAAPTTAGNSYYMTLPVTGASSHSGRDQFLKVTSVSDTGGPTNVVTSFANVQATYEPSGILFEWLSVTKIQVSSSTSLDHVGRIPISNGSNVRVAELTGTLPFDFALGPGGGAGGLQPGSTEAANAGYEIRYISGSSGHALLGTSQTSSALALPNGYTYSSDILWFVYNKNNADMAQFLDSGRKCTYGGFGPGSIVGDGTHNPYDSAENNFLVGDASEDALNSEWTPFSYDSQAPKNAKTVEVGFRWGSVGTSAWLISLSGSAGAYSDTKDTSNLILKIGSDEGDDELTQAYYLPASTPMMTGTIVYRFNRSDSGNAGYMWMRGWSF